MGKFGDQVVDKRGVRFDFVSYDRRISAEGENDLCRVILYWLTHRGFAVSVDREDDGELIKFRKLPRFGVQ